jgi:hypothetical protein
MAIIAEEEQLQWRWLGSGRHSEHAKPDKEDKGAHGMGLVKYK